jgi:hypothetical protein
MAGSAGATNGDAEQRKRTYLGGFAMPQTAG